jgi:mannose-6-phosphate isomerase-like protein (cupin superfamily)
VSEHDWQIFELDTEIEKQLDLLGPHDEDVVYFVIRGRGRLRVDGEERTVGPGSILYVRATSEHSFFEIEEDITLLVFFASGGQAAE